MGTDVPAIREKNHTLFVDVDGGGAVLLYCSSYKYRCRMSSTTYHKFYWCYAYMGTCILFQSFVFLDQLSVNKLRFGEFALSMGNFEKFV